MNHGGMDHGGMDHGGMGHDMCSMKMVFNWDIENVCVIFEQWHIRNALGMILSLIAIVALTAGYEFVRDCSRAYERRVDAAALNAPRSQASRHLAATKPIKALYYATQVFYSFFIMLLFMTYNGFIMIAVAVGAFVGYWIWGGHSATKTVACH